MEKELNTDSNVICFHEARNRLGLREQNIEIDVDQYQRYLDNADLTEVQKEEFLRAMWTVIVAFVDLGYGVHPTQNGMHAAELIELAPRAASMGGTTTSVREVRNV
ncbi:MAG: hypothetical protein JJ868_05190 [Shimia sp.]|uniref:hypothetical protein n=1 Tax=Shimia sp. TaxID=1954381 RepID=UPI001B21B778|nr:hypothetical protein [Shimia sp.]MBO6896748.1 hypothetical protein [Shimia sp.]